MQNEAMMSPEERMIYETFGGRDTIIKNLMKQFDSEGDLLNANGVAGMAVSYTHLDVYKRQSTTDRANGYVAAYAELYDEIVQGDVYKRQGCRGTRDTLTISASG